METGGNQMFENIKNIFKRSKKRELLKSSSKDTAKERLHLVLMQDRANVSADFLDLMRQEIIEVIKKYIDIDEEAMDVRLATETNEDGTQGAPALYANIPIINIKDETRQMSKTNQENHLEPNGIKIESKKTVNEEKMPETENKKNDENNEANEAYAEEKIEEVIQESKEETKENKDENENKEEKPEKSTEKVKQNETVKKETTEKRDKEEIKEEKKENEE